MRIGIDALGAISCDTGGRNYLLNFIRTCVQLEIEHEFYIYYSAPKEDLWGPLPSNYHKIIIPYTNGSSIAKVIGEQFLVPLSILRHQLDAFFFPTNFASLLIFKPKVVAIRSALYYHFPHEIPAFQRVYRKILSRLTVLWADRILVPSEAMRLDTIRFMGADPSKVRVVPHGVDGSLFKRSITDNELKLRLDLLGVQQPYFLFVSALWPYKGAHRFLEALNLLHKQFPVHGIIAGRGIASKEHCRELTDLIQSRHLGHFVRLLGDLPQSQLALLYWGATALVFPSYYESFGNPLVEAMAAGTPVIASNRHAIPDTVGGAGLIVDPDDVPAIVEAMRRVLDDGKLRAEMIERGRLRAQQFSWPRAVQAALALIEEVAQRKST
ncbi:MAG: glycosyltransferase family 1 protein [Verrucomicrobiae bacterium]|nr:glycosyltransferase family 1 protein [Verrucomicrobiae bacterium]